MKETFAILFGLWFGALPLLVPASSLACSIQLPSPEAFPRPGATDVSTSTKIMISASRVNPDELEVAANGAPLPVERVEEICPGHWRVVTGPLPPLATVRVKLADPELEGEYLTEFRTASGPAEAQGTAPKLVSLVLRQTHYVARNGSAGCLFADDQLWADFALAPAARSGTPEEDVLYELTIAAKDGSGRLDFCMVGEHLRASDWTGLASSWGAVSTSVEHCGSLRAIGREDADWQSDPEQVCTSVHTDQAWGCSSVSATSTPIAALLAVAFLIRRRQKRSPAHCRPERI